MDRRAACLNCIDGRVQLPVLQWIREQYPIDCVDLITAPGIDEVIATQTNIDDIMRFISISVNLNKAAHIFLAGHYDCKGNPVDENTHRDCIGKAVNRLKKRWPELEITGVWINSQWQVEVCSA